MTCSGGKSTQFTNLSTSTDTGKLGFTEVKESVLPKQKSKSI